MMPDGFDAIGAAMLAWLLTYAIHSTILLGLAALIAWRLADRHEWLDVIWKAALIGPLVTASLPLGPAAIPIAMQPPAPVVAPLTATPSPEAVRSQTDEATVERSTAAEPVSTPLAAAQPGQPEVPAVQERAAAAVWPAILRSWPSLALLAWLAIAIVGIARYGTKLIRVYRAVGAGESVIEPELLRAVDDLKDAAREPRAIALTTSDACMVPLALAGRQVVVPERFLDQLDADQQRAALAHEVAHVIRRDPAWRIVAGVVEHVLFFQPLNRVARARMGESAEFLCDRWAVQHTEPLALARCLSVVASWASPANDEWAVGASAMARSDSAMVRRVEHILNEPSRPAPRSRALWLAIPLALVAIAAPRVTAIGRDAVTVNPGIVELTETTAATGEQARERRQWTQAEIQRAQAELRVFRPANAADALENRWRWALADARRQGFSSFWVAYSFETPVHEGDLVMSDSNGNSFVSSGGRHEADGPPLMDVLRDGGGNLVVLMHYRGTADNAIDRAVYRSAGLGFDFGRNPVFWLGFADEAQSFARVRGMFERARGEKMQTLLIELASMHGNSNTVIPFLSSLVDLSQPSAIRNEAAEGFGHHHDPRSVEILARVARTDPVSEVRAEAAETIGEVQAPQAIPALTALVSESDDPGVRREAAEAFGDQPAAEAVPAIQQVLATSSLEDVLTEAVEALGDIGGSASLAVLIDTVSKHPHLRARQEAVETLGDIQDAAALEALSRIVWQHDDVEVQVEAVETIGDRQESGVVAELERILKEHPREEVQAEAIETLEDVSGSTIHPQIFATASSGRTARLRRDAVEAIGDAVEKIGDAKLFDQAEQAFEQALFNDPDAGVRMEALDSLKKLPRDRESRLLRKVIDGHPDNRLRREAAEHLRERQE